MPAWLAFLFVLGSLLVWAPQMFGQGCLAVRGGGQCSLEGSYLAGNEGGHPKAGDWQVSLNFRYIHSERHFIGDSEFTLPKQLGAQAINDAEYIDLSLLYTVSPRFSVGLTVPFSYSVRSTTYEHDNANRHETSAGGIGDVRLTAYYWLLDPVKHPKGNISLGLGPKFPTGDYNAKDTFYTTSGPVVRAVDPSVQPGDGGFGFTTEIQGFLELAPRWQGYLQGSYLFNPQDTNGVPVVGGPPNIISVTSIADQYNTRLGVTYTLVPSWGLSVSLGPRIDGVPVRDLLGKSDGFRRPGYAVSIEPGITWMKNDWTVSVTVPVAIYRNLMNSLENKRIQSVTGTYHPEDAAFADYFLTFSISRRF